MTKGSGSDWTYPHMCRDGHPEIGHRDSSEEMCPLCREKVRAERAEAALQSIKRLYEVGRVGTARELLADVYIMANEGLNNAL